MVPRLLGGTVKIGTKSLLFGAHQFILHPICVFVAWWKLYGFPWDPRLWVAFVIHDWGYWGSPDMDGRRGEEHPEWGGKVMGKLFGRQWYYWTIFHSRFLSRRYGAPFSELCVADKYATTLVPGWFYVPTARATGEIQEYRDIKKHKDDLGVNLDSSTNYEWYENFRQHMIKWVGENRQVAAAPWVYRRWPWPKNVESRPES